MKTFRLVIDDFSIFSRAYNVPSVIYYRVNVCHSYDVTHNTTDKFFRKKHFRFGISLDTENQSKYEWGFVGGFNNII